MKYTSFQFKSIVMFFFLVVNGVLHAAPLPNIVLIMADDLGYGDLSSYGAEDLQTPHIDSIAERGVRFTNYYANSTVCSPTRAALMTGRFSDLAGVPGVVRPDTNDSYGFLDPSLDLMPRYLKQKGYVTALIGKWHLGLSSPNLPNERGFDLFRGHLSGMMDYYSHEHHGVSYKTPSSCSYQTMAGQSGLEPTMAPCVGASRTFSRAAREVPPIRLVRSEARITYLRATQAHRSDHCRSGCSDSH